MSRIKLLSQRKGRSLPMMLAVSVLVSTSPMVTGCSRGEDQPAAVQSTQAQPSVAATAASAVPPPGAALEPGPPPGADTPQDLQELVSPIALYPDVLVAQILAGSTYPTQVVEADRWLKRNPNFSGDQLANQVNQQAWDPSIKSLTQFPTVLQTMNDNLAWTSDLGEAYYNQPADVMNAIQTLRNMAMAAGTLKSTPQQTVQVQPAPPAAQGAAQPSVQQTVIIQPAQPNTVYVPQYNPTTAYGAPIAAPPGYSGSDLLLTGVLSFGAGMLLGSLINSGHNDWGCNWYGGGGSSVKYNNNVYVTNNNVYPGRYPNGGGGTGRPHIARPMETIRARAIHHDRRLIQPPGPPTVAADTTVLTIRRSQRPGRMTRITRDLPIPISPNPVFRRLVRFQTMRAGLTRARMRSRRIDPISLRILSLELGPRILSPKIGPLTSRPIVQRTRPEASRRTTAVLAAVIALWAGMSRVEMHGLRATADKPASREIRNPLAVGLTVAAVATPNAAAAVEMAEVARIAAAGKRGNEEFQWRMK